MWRLDDEKEMDGAPRHELAVSGMVFARDTQTLTTSGKDGLVNIWNAATGEALATRREPAPVVSLLGVPHRDWLITGLINAAARRFAIQVRRHRDAPDAVATVSLDRFSNLALSDDGRILAAGGPDGTVRLYDFDAFAHAIDQHINPSVIPPVVQWQAHRKQVAAMAFFPDSQRLVTCAMENHVSIWDVRTGEASLRIQGTGDERFVSATALGDGHTLAVALADGRIRVWEEE
jgi:WD40 repeat protein